MMAVCDALRCNLEADNLTILTEINDETPTALILVKGISQLL
jgi:hypothetical protein